MVISLGVQSPPAKPASAVRAGGFHCGLLGISWWLFLAVLVLPLPAQERGEPVDESVRIEQVEIGLGGHYKVAEWTSIRMRVTSPSAQSLSLVVEAPDSDGNAAAVSGVPRDFRAGETQTIEACFRIGRLQGELLARLVDAEGKTVAQRRWRASAGEGAELRPALRHNVPFILTLADLPELGSVDSPAANSSSSLSNSGSSGPEPRLIRLPGLDSLPGTVRGLESVSALFLPTARKANGSSALTDLNPERNALLRDWVRGGGHLLVTVASEQQTFRDSPLAAWIPIRVEGTGALRQFLDLERYSDINSPVKFTGTVKTARLGSLPQKSVLVREGNSPLIAAMPFGFGRVTVIALDIESPPFASWPALPAVLKKLVGGSVGGARKSSLQGNRQLTQTGVTDLATQLQLAQEDFPTIDRPSHWWVMGLLVAYLLVIGPLDYFIVTRCLKRPELTWLTFSVLVCLGAGAAAWGANRINGAGMLCNQLDLIDIDVASNSIRGHSWVSIYSPENRRYAVAVEPVSRAIDTPAAAAPPLKPTLTWSGVPENSVSGVYRSGGAGLGGQRYQFEPDGRAAENLPILQWSTKSLYATWTGEASQNLVEGELESGGAGMLSGAITHHLPEPLEDAMFIVGGWAYFPAGEKVRIPPNTPWQPGGRQSRARDLKALLTGERRTRKETNDKYNVEVLTTTAPYNPLSMNRSDLVNMVSFHQVVGGGEYTGLNHAALRDLELTQLMGLGRGILIGRIKSAAARTTIDGQPASPADAQTFVRFVVPVVINERIPAATIPKREDRLPATQPQ